MFRKLQWAPVLQESFLKSRLKQIQSLNSLPGSYGYSLRHCLTAIVFVLALPFLDCFELRLQHSQTPPSIVLAAERHIEVVSKRFFQGTVELLTG